MSKAQLRRELRSRRAEFVSGMSLAERCAHYVQLAEHVMERIGNTRSVALYLAVGAEIDGCSIIAAAEAKGLTVALPWLPDTKGTMHFRQWRIGDTLVPGPFGIKQPRADAAEIAPDLILTPLVGFDLDMGRLGQGAGIYDRAFARLPEARRIGLAWSVQEVDSVPTDPWDVPLHAMLTEQGWVEPRASN